MSFPSHDAYWVGVADFLDTHLTPDDDILAPNEFEYRFVHCFRYPISHTVPVSGFQWVVLHKGMIDKVAIAFLLNTAKHLRPVYTNPVFVIFSSHTHLIPVPEEENNDLIDFNQKLDVLFQRNRSTITSPSCPTPVLSLPSIGIASTPNESTVSQADPAALYPSPPNTAVKVSIITICRNAAATIEQTIQHIAAQTYPNIEYIVVDGASEDETIEVCDRYSSTITTVVSEPDDGIYQAMNKGIGLATGDWLYFANADDYLFDPYVIQDFVAYINDHPDADVIYGDHEARFPDGSASIHTPVAPNQMLETMICLKASRIHQPTCLFKADVFNRFGRFNEDYHIASDYKWFIDALPFSEFRLHYVPRTIVSYAHGGASGNIRALFEEVFKIQSNHSLCQEPQWLMKQLTVLKQEFIDKYERLEDTHYRLIDVERLVAIRDRHLIQRKQRID